MKDRLRGLPLCALLLCLGACGVTESALDLGRADGGGGAVGDADLRPSTDPLRDCMMQTLPRLTVLGNQLTIRCGERAVPTRLKGLNRSGLQHKNGLAAAGFGDGGANLTAELRRWRDEWRAVVVRLPVGQTYYLYYPQYQQDLAAVVAATKALGMYLMIELHGYDANNLSHMQPDPETTPGFWAQLAARFGGETHVLFDIWNEPYGVQWSQWKGNAEKILRAIRGAGATETLVVVGGLDYAYDLSMLADPQNRIEGLGPVIYATHPYPLKSNPPSMAGEWDQRFGAVARSVPVIIGEYGVNDSGESPFGLGSKAAAHGWMTQLHAYIDQKGLSALAWSGGDKPQLTEGTGGGDVSLPGNPPDPGRPTDPFGVDVKAWMLKPIL